MGPAGPWPPLPQGLLPYKVLEIGKTKKKIKKEQNKKGGKQNGAKTIKQKKKNSGIYFASHTRKRPKVGGDKGCHKRQV